MALEAQGSNPCIHPVAVATIIVGLSPSGKAQDFDSCIPGSNPGSLIGCMLTFHVATYVFHMYLNPWLSDSSIWVPPFATRTILLRTVRDRPVVFVAEDGILA